MPPSDTHCLVPVAVILMDTLVAPGALKISLNMDKATQLELDAAGRIRGNTTSCAYVSK